MPVSLGTTALARSSRTFPARSAGLMAVRALSAMWPGRALMTSSPEDTAPAWLAGWGSGGWGVPRLLPQPFRQPFVSRVARAEHDAVPGGQQPSRNGPGDDPSAQ